MSALEPTSGLVDLEGARLWHEMAGAGSPLVLLHAGIADSRMWDDQMAPFAARHQTLRYDLRGYGRSPAVDGSFAHWRDLRALLVALDLERVALVGASMGGAAALDFALECPDLVAAPPSGFDYFDPPPSQWPEAEAAFDAGDLERVAELETEIWVDGARRGPTEVDSVVRARARDMALLALQSEASGLGDEEPLEPPAVERLEEVRAPTLIVTGDLDMAGILRGAALMAERIPGARTGTIHGTAHLPNMERPDEFAKIVLDFLSEVG